MFGWTGCEYTARVSGFRGVAVGKGVGVLARVVVALGAKHSFFEFECFFAKVRVGRPRLDSASTMLAYRLECHTPVDEFIQCRRLGGAVAQHGNVRDAGGASAVFIYLGIPRYCVYAESPDPEKQ